MIEGTIALPDGAGGWINVTVNRPVDGKWVPVMGAPAAPSAPFTPDTGPLRNIATNCAVLQNQWQPGASGGATLSRHTIHANAASLTIGYFARPNPAFGVTTATPLRAWVRAPGGAWTPLTFGGAPEVTLAQPPATAEAVLPTHGQNIYSDPVPGTWRYGDVIDVLTWGQSTSGTYGTQTNLAAPHDGGRVAGAHGTVTTAAASAYTLGVRGARPSAILAPSAQPSSWALVGDSNSVLPSAHYMVQAFRTRNLPHVVNGKHGLGTYHLAGDWWNFQLGEQLKHADSVFSALGTNDSNGGNPDPRVNFIAAWNKAAAAGVVRWVQATRTPFGIRKPDGSTDWPDSVAKVVAHNAWLLDGAPVLNGAPAPVGSTATGTVRARVARRDGTVKPGSGAHPMGDGWVADTAWVLEDPADSGMWDSAYPDDPNHYNQAGHDAQAPVLAGLLDLMGF